MLQVQALASPDRHHLCHISTPSVKEAFSSLFLSLSLWPTKAEKLTRSLIYKPISLPSPPSDPPTNLWSFTSLFLSIYLSLSLSHNRCSFLRNIEFFFVMIFCWFGLYIQISYYNICLETEKMWENVFSGGFSETWSNNLKYFPKHFLWCDQTPEIIFISKKYFHLKIFYTLKSFYIEPNLGFWGFCSCSYVLVCSYF